MKIVALYFSGTGNTAYVVRQIGAQVNKHISFRALNIEAVTHNNIGDIEQADLLLFAYPIYGSLAPLLMRQFVAEYGLHFSGKRAAIIITQVLFSGDGGAYLARKLRKFDVDVVAIEHFNMPNNISDSTLFKIRSQEVNAETIKSADIKITRFTQALLEGKAKTVGDNLFSRLLGLVQRLPFSLVEKRYRARVKIDQHLCNMCTVCVQLCPTDNLREDTQQIAANSHCTLCYRCVNLCPQKAISIFSKKKPRVQYKGVR